MTFATYLKEGEDILRRQKRCEALGTNNLPEHERVKDSEWVTWFETILIIAEGVFGSDSSELKEWKGFAQRRQDMIEDYYIKAPAEGFNPMEPLVNHMQLCMATLTAMNLKTASRQENPNESFLIKKITWFGFGIDLEKLWKWISKRKSRASDA